MGSPKQIEFTNIEKEMLISLYGACRFHLPNGNMGWSGHPYNILGNKLKELNINYNSDVFGSHIALGRKASRLVRGGYLWSCRLRYESGYGAVQTYHSLTRKGFAEAEPLFLEIYNSLPQSKKDELSKKEYADWPRGIDE